MLPLFISEIIDESFQVKDTNLTPSIQTVDSFALTN